MNPLDPELTLIGALPEDSTEPASIRNSVAPQPTETAGGNSFSEITEPQRAIELVRGSRHRLDDETQELLHERLRAVTIVLFIAVFVFWIRNLFLADTPVLGMQGLASGILIASVMEEYNKDAWCEIIERCQDAGVDAFEFRVLA